MSKQFIDRNKELSWVQNNSQTVDILLRLNYEELKIPQKVEGISEIVSLVFDE